MFGRCRLDGWRGFCLIGGLDRRDFCRQTRGGGGVGGEGGGFGGRVGRGGMGERLGRELEFELVNDLLDVGRGSGWRLEREVLAIFLQSNGPAIEILVGDDGGIEYGGGIIGLGSQRGTG